MEEENESFDSLGTTTEWYSTRITADAHRQEEQDPPIFDYPTMIKDECLNSFNTYMVGLSTSIERAVYQLLKH